MIQMNLAGVIGYPIDHSFSPAMHNAAFQALNMDWLYLPLAVKREGLGDAIRGLNALNFSGINVTVPHKVEVMEHLDHIDDMSRNLGAVNTISFKAGKSIGTNTDPAGFLRSLEEVDVRLPGSNVAVLGAGGAARGVIYALAQAQVKSVTVVNRTVSRAEVLIQEMSPLFPPGTLQALPMEKESFEMVAGTVNLVVNSTAVGLAPMDGECPWPENVPMPAGATYYDLVYNPRNTVFLSRAKEAGAETISGLGMLIHQGALSFEIWTGRQAPIDVMRHACEAAAR